MNNRIHKPESLQNISVDEKANQHEEPSLWQYVVFMRAASSLEYQDKECHERLARLEKQQQQEINQNQSSPKTDVDILLVKIGLFFIHKQKIDMEKKSLVFKGNTFNQQLKSVSDNIQAKKDGVNNEKYLASIRLFSSSSKIKKIKYQKDSLTPVISRSLEMPCDISADAMITSSFNHAHCNSFAQYRFRRK